jgi:signal recognition particle subunit SRP54
MPAACWAWATSSALVEEVQRGRRQEAAQKLAEKVKSGKGFDLNDFLDADQPDEEDGRPVVA